MGVEELPTASHQKVFAAIWRTVREALFLLQVGTLCVLALMVRKGVCRSKASMEGKTVVVTGANAGIGKATAMELARRKARVILACRNMDKAKRAAQEIFESTGQSVVIKELDLASFKSVNDFCDDILKTESRLDVLVNNAGIVTDSKAVRLTEDGYELCYQSNYLSHYLLTMRLLGLLRKSAPSRVVNVSSAVHHLGTLDDPDKLARGLTSVRHPTYSYACSKLAQVAFTRSLAHKLRHTGVTVNALHPGDVKTDIATNSPGGLFFSLLLAIGGKTAEEGAQTSIHLAVEPQVGTGHYYSDCRRAWISRQAANRRKCERFFWHSARLVHLDEDMVNSLIGKL
ncbi:retinol dehydrogenase 12-like [Rhipicephalus microplus]|uniref:retinol dehydrogenase 12-like n=1 Tax=Rhipicephalus microplus TaxID=6941 RepID=UPI003F6BF890